MTASQKYKDKYWSISGKVKIINSNGDYIDIYDKTLAYDISDAINIRCYTKSDLQKQDLLKIKKEDTINLWGKCTQVSEILGYTITIEELFSL